VGPSVGDSLNDSLYSRTKNFSLSANHTIGLWINPSHGRSVDPSVRYSLDGWITDNMGISLTVIQPETNLGVPARYVKAVVGDCLIGSKTKDLSVSRSFY
jgi:hypothetical protein